MIRGRYAPSPTGRLHFGNLRTAMIAWLQAKLNQGHFILRIDDLDQPRNIPGSIEQILDDLKWLGISWDEGPYLQSQRTHYYQVAFSQLQELNFVYPCVCSRKDIAMAISAPNFGQTTHVYPGTCRPEKIYGLNVEDDGEYTDSDSQKSWRYQVPTQELRFKDRVSGLQRLYLPDTVGDFVVKRKDGLFAYQLASIVDDDSMGVTDVVRGNDLLDSTVRQLALADSLGYVRPRFWHLPMLLDQQGERMSKRGHAETLSSWQQDNKTSAQLIGSFAYGLGLIDEPAVLSSQELLQQLDPKMLEQKLRSNSIENADNAT